MTRETYAVIVCVSVCVCICVRDVPPFGFDWRYLVLVSHQYEITITQETVCSWLSYTLVKIVFE